MTTRNSLPLTETARLALIESQVAALKAGKFGSAAERSACASFLQALRNHKPRYSTQAEGAAILESKLRSVRIALASMPESEPARSNLAMMAEAYEQELFALGM